MRPWGWGLAIEPVVLGVPFADAPLCYLETPINPASICRIQAVIAAHRNNQ